MESYFVIYLSCWADDLFSGIDGLVAPWAKHDVTVTVTLEIDLIPNTTSSY
jgi:hypothetical protein